MEISLTVLKYAVSVKRHISSVKPGKRKPMMTNKTIFNIEIAGVPVRIECGYAKNKDFFRDYITDKEPLFTAAPDEEDLQKILTVLRETEEFKRHPNISYSRDFLENNAIHSLLAEKLLNFNVLLMHGSAVVMDGEAYIFTAKSGTGKSTHTRFWLENFKDRAYIINDDKPMLRIEGGSVTVYGTPWDGKHRLSRNTSAPLKAIIYLTRDEKNHIEPYSKKDAFSVIFSQCYRSENRDSIMKIFELEKELLSSVGLYKLGCNTDPSAAAVAYSGMNYQKGTGI